jgi:hypothetical protein
MCINQQMDVIEMKLEIKPVNLAIINKNLLNAKIYLLIHRYI